MKKLILVLLATFALNAFANNPIVAKKLYKKRGADVNNAVKAAKVYGTLATKATEAYKKGKFLLLQSEALYYVGSVASTDSEKMKMHKEGFDVAKVAIDTLEGNTSNNSQVKTLARIYFFYGANLGQWASANGVMASLQFRGEMFETMDKIIELGMKEVDQYGALRINGRVHFKLPKLFDGNKKLAEKELAEAFDNTLAPNAQVSVHGLNNIYYAEVLKARKKKVKACTILKDFSEQDYKTLLKSRVPETKKEIEDAKVLFEDWNCKKTLR